MTDNIRLVGWVLQRYWGPGCDREEMYSAGLLGLVRAASMFDPSRGLAFSTLAVPCIRNEIIHFLRREMKGRWLISLDQPVGIDSEGNELAIRDILSVPGDVAVAVEESLERTDRRIVVREALYKLPERYRRVLVMRYFKGMDQLAIAASLRLSQSRVSRQIRAGLKFLRHLLGEERGSVTMQADDGKDRPWWEVFARVRPISVGLCKTVEGFLRRLRLQVQEERRLRDQALMSVRLGLFAHNYGEEAALRWLQIMAPHSGGLVFTFQEADQPPTTLAAILQFRLAEAREKQASWERVVDLATKEWFPDIP